MCNFFPTWVVPDTKSVLPNYGHQYHVLGTEKLCQSIPSALHLCDTGTSRSKINASQRHTNVDVTTKDDDLVIKTLSCFKSNICCGQLCYLLC